MSLFELKEGGGKQNKEMQWKRASCKRDGRFISSLVLEGLSSRYCSGYGTEQWKEERKKLEAASCDELV